MSAHAVLDEINQALEKIGLLRGNWDSYGAPPITSTAIKAARSLLNGLVSAEESKLGDSLRPYSLVPLASGGLQITWRSSHAAELEVEIGPDGEFGYLLIPPEGLPGAVEQDDVSPQTVVAIVARTLKPSSSQHASD